MAKATRVLSTPPTNTSLTRRKILGTIAVGTVAAVGFRPRPRPQDPRLIRSTRRSKRTARLMRPCRLAEHRKAHELADVTVGPAPLDIPSMAEPGKTVEVSGWWNLEKAVPREQYPDLYAHHKTVLDERRAAHAAIVESLIGDEDEATNEVSHAELDALHAFAETVPTTLPGLLAMIVYAGECSAHDADAFADSDCPLIETLATAAKALSQVQS
jgi:hypothetical protein